MASPVAHSLTGAIIYSSTGRRPLAADPELWWLVLAACLPDFDLIPGVLLGDDSLFHRTFSHSIPAAVLFALVVYLICLRRGIRAPVRATLLMAIAYLSHLLVDFVSFDPGPVAGIPLFWPFSYETYMADATVFLKVERNNLWSTAIIIHNIKAVLLEITILGPPAALCWWNGRRRASKDPGNRISRADPSNVETQQAG